MMGQLGFSYVGALFLLALLLPNLFWTRRRPVDYDPSGENCLLLCLERIGQAMVTCMGVPGLQLAALDGLVLVAGRGGASDGPV